MTNLNTLMTTFVAYCKQLGPSETETNASPKSPTHRDSLLPASTKREYLQLIQRYMLETKPHLDSNLTVTQLANGMGISTHHLSHVINTELDQNFFDFINNYRIADAKRILDEDAQGKRSITEVMYDVGFNSKSVFNTYFKKLTGMTPSQYRKRYAFKMA